MRHLSVLTVFGLVLAVAVPTQTLWAETSENPSADGTSANWLALGLEIAAAESRMAHGGVRQYQGGTADTDKAADTPEEGSFVPFVDYSGGLWARPALTGDWGGLRTDLINKGVRFNIDLTQMYQGVVDGGTKRHWKYGGLLDMVLDIDTGKAGLWQGGFLHMRAVTQYGESINMDTGAMLAANLNAAIPLPDQHEINLTAVVYTQFLAEWFGVFVGKIDTLDGDGNHFAGARGKDQFTNISLVVNPAMLRTVPASALGGGCIFLLPNLWGNDKDPGSLAFTVLDAGGQPNTSGFGDAFDDGTVLTWELRTPTEFFGLPGSQVFGAVYSTRDFVSLEQNPRLILAGLLGLIPLQINQENDSYAFYYNFHQYLWVKPDQKRESTGTQPQTKLLQGIGVFGRFGCADPKTSPIKNFYSIGLAGRGLVPGRENDTLGAGFFYLTLSNELGPIIQNRFGDAGGVEVFYNIEVTPWLHITPDIQVINPSNENVDTAVVMGVRAKIDF